MTYMITPDMITCIGSCFQAIATVCVLRSWFMWLCFSYGYS